MITTTDIKNLANLARIEITEEEASSLTSEIDAILSYVGQIQNAVGDVDNTLPKLHNVMRQDVVTNETSQYTEAILQNAPSREKKYLKVKKILG